MNHGMEPILGGLVSGGAVCLGLLWLGERLRAGPLPRSIKWACVIITIGVMWIPLRGVPLWNWVFTFCPNPSLPLVGVVAVALARHLGEMRLLQPREWRTLWVFGAVAGTLLYLHPLLPSGSDPYYWGWHHAVSVWALAGLALAAFATGNRTGFLFLAALIAYELQVLESPNGWDYLVDPFYWMLSLGLGVRHCLRVAGTWRALPRESRPPFAALVFGRVARE
jgi:hypothetical protein